jgi:lipopolysaccharide transport system permease protein
MSAVAERSPARAPAHPHDEPVTVFEPWRPGVLPRLEEIWRFRSLIPYLGKQFIFKRYRKTFLSWIWIPLRPGIDIASRALLFGGFLQVGSGDRPYFIFLAFASAGWVIFNSCLHWGVRAVKMSRSIASGVHFPRTLPVIAATFPAAVDFLLYALVAVVGTLYYLIAKGQNYLAPIEQMPVAALGVLLLVMLGLSFGMVIAPLAVVTKEVRYLLGYGMQFWYFVTPVVYAVSSLPQKYQPIAVYNPVTAPLEMIRYGLLSTSAPETASIISCAVTIPVFLVIGLLVSSRFERAAVARL